MKILAYDYIYFISFFIKTEIIFYKSKPNLFIIIVIRCYKIIKKVKKMQIENYVFLFGLDFYL